MSDSYAIMVKPVGSRCNMHCRYCYYLEKDKYSAHETQSVMSEAMLEKLIREAVSLSDGTAVSFVWHGGEPALAGLPFYRKALQLERRYLKPGQEVWNNLQTNGLLIDDTFAAFLSRHHFDVGVSIDGTELLHDKNRPDLGGHGTYGRAVDAVKTLKKYGIKPDLLCTVNRDTVKAGKACYEALRDLDTGWIQFIPVTTEIDAESYGDFLIEVFDAWVRNDIGKCDVQLFAEMAQILAGKQPALCWMAETCGHVLIAEEDGSVYACDHFVDDGHRIGNFMTGNLPEIAASKFQVDFGNAKKDMLTEECRRCPYLDFCHGACPKDRHGFSEDGEKGQYMLCRGLKIFFSHALPRLKKEMKKRK